MKTPAWVIRDIDLADGPLDLPPADQPHLLVFWWKGLPLGIKALLADELPFRRSQMRAAAAELIAQQAAARTELPRAGYDGAPSRTLTLAAALEGRGALETLDQAAAAPPVSAERLSVVICTRDRPHMLRACLDSLAAQTAPPGQVVVVDNSANGNVRDLCAPWGFVTYVHEPRPGLSIARNAGVAAARGEFVAFTDDDVELTPDWTAEIVRAFAAADVEAVTGLVLPAALDTPAQYAFELELGGFMSRHHPLLFDRGFLQLTQGVGPQVWRIGAGANMAFRRSVFARCGLFDERLGAGASGCSEDSEYWYRILAAGGRCLYEPRAVVRHHHRADWPGLHAQFRAYMKGHVAALVAQADRYGHRGNIRRIFKQLPAYFVHTAIGAAKRSAWWRVGLLAHEVAGWAAGLSYLARPRWRRAGRPARAPATFPEPAEVKHA